MCLNSDWQICVKLVFTYAGITWYQSIQWEIQRTPFYSTHWDASRFVSSLKGGFLTFGCSKVDVFSIKSLDIWTLATRIYHYCLQTNVIIWLFKTLKTLKQGPLILCYAFNAHSNHNLLYISIYWICMIRIRCLEIFRQGFYKV